MNSCFSFLGEGSPDLPGLGKLPFLSVPSRTPQLPQEHPDLWMQPRETWSFWRPKPVTVVPALQQVLCVHQWMSTSRGQEPPRERAMGTHLFCCWSFLSLPRICFLRKLPKLTIWSSPQEGEASPTVLTPSPRPSKFGVGIVYYHFRGASEIQALSSSHFFFFHWDICWDISGTFPCINLKLALGIKICYFI